MKLLSFFQKPLQLDNFHLWSFFVLFWIGLGWTGLIFSLLGIFYIQFFVIYVGIFGLGIIFILTKNQKPLRILATDIFAIIVIIFAIIIFSLYSTPSVFSGRDEGSLSLAAAQLAQSHHLEFSTPASQEFFKIYGSGSALNFPGFNYAPSGNLITQFPIGYIAWLAIFFSFFGITGFIIANAITFFIFAFSFYLLARYYLKKETACVALALILSSFVFSWFFKFTLSENLALAFLWFGIHAFVLFSRHHNRFYLTASILSLGLLCFARIEALVFLLIIFAILLFKYRDWRYIAFVVIGKKIIMLLGGIILVYIFNIAVDKNFYVSILKGFLKSFASFGKNLTVSGNTFTESFYLMKIFLTYNILIYLILGISAIIYIIYRKNFKLLIPFIIVSPSFIYLINPSISIDHPWMLRRFVFSIIPILILYTAWVLDNFSKRKIIFYFFSLALISINLFILIPYITFSPNRNLLSEIKAIGNNFDDHDLILIDQKATGDGWNMMSGPLNILYHKQAVYFFNPNNLTKIDLQKWQNIYFIIPDDADRAIYQQTGLINKLKPVHNYFIQYSTLDIFRSGKNEILAHPVYIPAKTISSVYGKIYLLTK